MKTLPVIAHRGNLHGPNPATENTWDQVMKAIDAGFDVEIDVWVKGHTFLLGHDSGVHVVDLSRLRQHSTKLWIHCKNLEAMSEFFQANHMGDEFNYFWHDKDQYTLTSTGIIWAYMGAPHSRNTVIVLPELWYKGIVNGIDYYTVCTDYPYLF